MYWLPWEVIFQLPQDYYERYDPVNYDRGKVVLRLRRSGEDQSASAYLNLKSTSIQAFSRRHRAALDITHSGRQNNFMVHNLRDLLRPNHHAGLQSLVHP